MSDVYKMQNNEEFMRGFAILYNFRYEAIFAITPKSCYKPKPYGTVKQSFSFVNMCMLAGVF